MAKTGIELANGMILDNGNQNKTPGIKQGVHVRDWIKQNYPDEFQTDLIKYPMTFEELNDAWKEDQEGGDFYTVASQNGKGFDSEVREKIFNGLVEHLGGDYDDYYYRWLGRENPNSLYRKLRKPATQGYKSKLATKYPDRYKTISQSFKDSFGNNFGDEQLDELARALGVDID